MQSSISDIIEAMHPSSFPDGVNPTDSIDLTDPDDLTRLRRLADQLLDADGPEVGSDAPLDLRAAAMLARSKQIVDEIDLEAEVAVIYAMWGEQNRLRPATADNPTGEDSLRVKLDQLDWLFGGSGISWRLVPVDDGCPHSSATIAEQRAADHPLGDRVEVLRLGDVLPAADGPLARLASADDSRKGGALILGATHALATGADAIVFTDADNSVDLGQLGLLLGPWFAGVPVVLGDRKSPESVLVKQEDRWGPGIVVLRHLQRMVGRTIFSRGISDTQAAFKLYGRDIAERILGDAAVFDFSVDTDWILGAIDAEVDITRVPFAFIDSFAESASITQGPMTTWESLLRGLTTAVRARSADHDADAASVIDRYADAETLDLVVANVPPALEGVDTSRLGDSALMSASDVAAWIETLR
ncbi:MAG: glycosyltransferase [Actinomycetia bacterium]|nr:glycosyltransferase [Actinomycetes bacterium]MCP4960084.1 glycosyltransferase [Actinomycetes bacterium]